MKVSIIHNGSETVSINYKGDHIEWQTNRIKGRLLSVSENLTCLD